MILLLITTNMIKFSLKATCMSDRLVGLPLVMQEYCQLRARYVCNLKSLELCLVCLSNEVRVIQGDQKVSVHLTITVFEQSPHN